jgi:nitrite reductase (NADH) large subunit
MKKEKLVIIGNGIATMRLLQAMQGQDRFQITVLSADSTAHYNRVMLSPLLSGETTLADISFSDGNWYVEQFVDIKLNHRASSVNTATREVVCENGFSCVYDRLIIATGAVSTGPNIPGLGLQNVRFFRDIEDVTAMRNVAIKNEHCVVVGAGLLGVEAASGLAKQGAKVSLIHRSNNIMNRQIDGRAAKLLSKALLSRGIILHMGAEFGPAEVTGETATTGIRMNNGVHLPANLVIFATGIRPNITLAKAAGIACNSGINVNAKMETSVSSVYALGESCEFDGNTYGLVAPILQQAKVLADVLLDGHAVYQETLFTTKLKVSGMDVHSMGDFGDDVNECSEQATCSETIVFEDASLNVYRKIKLRDNKIVGAVLYGDVSDSQWYFELMKNNTIISAMRTELALGRAFNEPSLKAA